MGRAGSRGTNRLGKAGSRLRRSAGRAIGARDRWMYERGALGWAKNVQLRRSLLTFDTTRRPPPRFSLLPSKFDFSSARNPPGLLSLFARSYSHSIVAGGFELMS